MQLFWKCIRFSQTVNPMGSANSLPSRPPTERKENNVQCLCNLFSLDPRFRNWQNNYTYHYYQAFADGKNFYQAAPECTTDTCIVVNDYLTSSDFTILFLAFYVPDLALADSFHPPKRFLLFRGNTALKGHNEITVVEV